MLPCACSGACVCVLICSDQEACLCACVFCVLIKKLYFAVCLLAHLCLFCSDQEALKLKSETVDMNAEYKYESFTPNANIVYKMFSESNLLLMEFIKLSSCANKVHSCVMVKIVVCQSHLVVNG